MDIKRIDESGDIKIIMSKDEAKEMQRWLYHVTSYSVTEQFKDAIWIGNRIGMELER